MNFRWARLAAIAVVAAAGLLAVWAVRRLNGETGVLPMTGTVEATQVEVSATITGRIIEILVRRGQPVEPGQVLVVLESGELAADVGRAEATLRAAEAQLRNLKSGSRPEAIREAEARAARAQAARAQAQLDDLLAGSRIQEIEQARAALRRASIAREWTQRELSRARELFTKEVIAAQEVDRAKQAYDSAAANEAAARERLALLEAGPRQPKIEAARAELKAARERVQLLKAGARPQAIEAARARVAEGRAALELTRARLDEARLVSPMIGLVLRQNAEVGETVTPGVSILTLMAPRDLWVRVDVRETDIGHVKLGQEAAITVNAYPGRLFAGRVTEITSEAELTPKNVQTRERLNLVFRVKVAIGNPDGVLTPGLPADVKIRP